MRCWLLSFFITVLPGLSEAGNLVFSLEKRTHYSDFSAHSTFTFMDDGSYSFETSTGGFRLCSGLPAGKFSGQLDRAQTETLLSSFKEMGAACKALDNCETSANRWGGALWILSGRVGVIFQADLFHTGRCLTAQPIPAIIRAGKNAA